MKNYKVKEKFNQQKKEIKDKLEKNKIKKYQNLPLPNPKNNKFLSKPNSHKK